MFQDPSIGKYPVYYVVNRIFHIKNTTEVYDTENIFINYYCMFFCIRDCVMHILRTVPTSVIAHTFCASRDTRVSVMLTNTWVFLRGLKLSG